MNKTNKLAASGIIHTGQCELNVFLLGTDGVNDITDLAVYDGTDATGEEKIPTSDYEADYKGLNGATELHMICYKGIYVDFACAGAAEVIIGFRPL